MAISKVYRVRTRPAVITNKSLIEQYLRQGTVNDYSIWLKAKGVHKFGRNLDVGTSETTIMNLPSGELHETYIADNLITHISSTNAGDTQVVALETHYYDDEGQFIFHVMNVQLQGTTAVALPRAVARVSRAYINDDDVVAPPVGDIYVHQNGAVVAGSIITASGIHITIPAGKYGTYKAATTLSRFDGGGLTAVWLSLNQQGGGTPNIDLELQTRELGKTFRPRQQFAINRNQPFVYRPFDPYLSLNPNSDIRIVATASATGLSVSAGFDIALAKRARR